MQQIEIKNYHKQFGNKTIFDNFNITIQAGESVAFMGESGCGKTTLLNVLGLIEPIEQGDYFLDGERAPNVNTSSASKVIREKISYLFQNFALVDSFSVEENLLMAMKYVNLSQEEKRLKIAEALNRVGLKGFEQKKIYEISGGEQQRVAIARLLLKPSEIILADEPTGSVDAKNRDEILTILHALNKAGKTLVIVTHDETVAKSCERVVHL